MTLETALYSAVIYWILCIVVLYLLSRILP